MIQYAMPEIAARLFNTPLMLHEGKANIIARAFGPRVLGRELDMNHGPEMGVLSEDMRELRDGWTGRKPTTVRKWSGRLPSLRSKALW